MLLRALNKIRREIYRALHPSLWGKRLQINGIPSIYGVKNLMLGYDVSLNDYVLIQCSGGGEVSIGDRVTLSRGVTILTAGLDTKDYLINANKKIRDHVVQNVVIGEGTWLATNVIVCPGVIIAKNCIVAAGAVVSGDLSEEGCLYGGVPAKLIKRL